MDGLIVGVGGCWYDMFGGLRQMNNYILLLTTIFDSCNLRPTATIAYEECPLWMMVVESVVAIEWKITNIGKLNWIGAIDGRKTKRNINQTWISDQLITMGVPYIPTWGDGCTRSPLLGKRDCGAGPSLNYMHTTHKTIKARQQQVVFELVSARWCVEYFENINL